MAEPTSEELVRQFLEEAAVKNLNFGIGKCFVGRKEANGDRTCLNIGEFVYVDDAHIKQNKPLDEAVAALRRDFSGNMSPSISLDKFKEILKTSNLTGVSRTVFEALEMDYLKPEYREALLDEADRQLNSPKKAEVEKKEASPTGVPDPENTNPLPTKPNGQKTDLVPSYLR